MGCFNGHTFRESDLTRIALTYDTYCKRSMHAENRVQANFSDAMPRALPLLEGRRFVAQLHIYAHETSCHTRPSLNCHRGACRTTEGPEEHGGAVVLAALQTSVMHPGSHYRAIDNHWIGQAMLHLAVMSASLELRGANIRRLTQFAENVLLRRLRFATGWARQQRDVIQVRGVGVGRNEDSRMRGLVDTGDGLNGVACLDGAICMRTAKWDARVARWEEELTIITSEIARSLRLSQ
jgi:hypothetical protein